MPLLTQLGYEMSLEEAAQRVRDVMSTADHLVLVADVGGRVVGLLHVFVRPAIENPREAVVQALVVGEAYRRAGVDAQLDGGGGPLGIRTRLSFGRAEL